ncbi:glycosyltransferase [Paraburkholderia terricola]|uniref:Glycosyltransferase involved in cell wall biosynthesis n=1 Tax=Paraburkholderia terricola TaxID=169427 RepID=A0ABU1LK24_9BURK|nr:glycosyltransferase [Paraburkholderia terricola]MDR6407091.1 glycosyltransferase involved in cell wall biosynthesis [Paraburkholderia terricola]MDR6479231.1 glycosyltransferase involved in cell wall biosynthesis [Paraburkholderia terricola]
MQQKILHVTEALGGGVLHCVVLLANRQVTAGDDVVVLHSLRHDTPPSAKLDELFDPRVRRQLVDMRTSIGAHDIASVFRLMIELFHERPDIVHLHSSKAAALGRIATLLLGISARTIYSPHGFAFLKEDISSLQAKLFLLIERMLHATGGHIVACSKSELRYARMLLLHADRTSLIENAVKVDEFESDGSRPVGEKLVVCTSARVTYQKAPWRFTRLAQRLAAKSNVSFTWFGDGEADAVSRWIDCDAIHLSGWISAQDLRRRLRQCDIFVLPSLWEGMPIALIEAQTAGLPAIASRVVGNRDVIVHGVTGFLVNNDEELEHYTRQLIDDAPLRERMGAAASAHARARFSDAQLFRSYVAIHRRLLPPRAYRVPARTHALPRRVLK